MIYSSRLLAIMRLLLFTMAILLFIPIVMPSLWFVPQKSKYWREKMLMRFHRLCLRIIGIKVVIKGEMSPHRPTYFVCNHLSYIDIILLGGHIPAAFISKQEIAGWPIIGWLAKIQRSVFLERSRSATTSHKPELQKRLSDGDNLIVFAEGTTGDGNWLLPFRSTLFAVVEEVVPGQELWVQPMTLAYTKLDGTALGRDIRPFIAWYGAMTFIPHMWFFMGMGKLTAQIEFHTPQPAHKFSTRKEWSDYCFNCVQAGYEHALAPRAAAKKPQSQSASSTLPTASPVPSNS